VKSLIEKLNGPWHKPALQVFMVIVLAHWAEHLVQAYQVYALKWPMHDARGVLGQAFPWLVHSEVLHYSYAVIMLAGIWAFLPGFVGRARTWWLAALVIQFWHHIEHFLLIWQATFHHNFWGRPAPCSVLQLVFPRVELHLFYNAVVFVPMVIGMYYHMFPPETEQGKMACTCEWGHKPSMQAA